MLPPPESLYPAFRVGIVSCLAFGAICSIPSIWDRFFPKEKDGSPVGGSYLKAGEYGETEMNTSWSVFKEPFNAWTSLSYSIFGVVIFIVGFSDYLMKLNGDDIPNVLTLDSSFSMTLGSFCVYLGISSFLFHASHSETWRKADAGMTSGIMLPLVMFALWDRSRPLVLSAYAMIALCNVLLLSLTNGYVPYGSSDVLLPTLIIIVWSFEMLPRYGGVVDNYQYHYWLQCFFAVAGGALLRAIDVKRNAIGIKRLLLAIYLSLLVIFAFFLGVSDYTVILGVTAALTVLKNPAWGHIFWHIASSYALFIWWCMLRLRPGDAVTAKNTDNHITTILLFLTVKNAVRRLLMNVPTNIMPIEYRDRVRVLFEHTFFSIWGYCTIITVPIGFHSWFANPVLCWHQPSIPFDTFHLYYTAKVAAYLEDVIYLWVNGKTYSSSGTTENDSVTISDTEVNDDQHDGKRINNNKGSERDYESGSGNASIVTTSSQLLLQHNKLPLRRGGGVHSSNLSSLFTALTDRVDGEHIHAFHHNIAAMIAVASYIAGYSKIGSLVMLIHDISAVPQDLFRLFLLKGWRKMQLTMLTIAVPWWIYWRVWIYCTVVLYTVVLESKSMTDKLTCLPGECSWMQVPEKVPFLLCLVVLLLLNSVWCLRMMRKAYKIVFLLPLRPVPV